MGLHDGHRQRKKAAFVRNGLEGFADHEVLELLLYYAIPRRDTNELAHRLLHRFGSLDKVLCASAEELQQVEGMGENAAVFLNLLSAVGWRLYYERVHAQPLNSVSDAGEFFLRLLQSERKEKLYQVNLDGKGKLLNYSCLSAGSRSMTSVCVREVVENAIHANASQVLLGHNHPSGVALPSQEDQQVTQEVSRALKTIGITLVDHIVVADGDYVSMAASGMIL